MNSAESKICAFTKSRGEVRDAELPRLLNILENVKAGDKEEAPLPSYVANQFALL